MNYSQRKNKSKQDKSNAKRLQLLLVLARKRDIGSKKEFVDLFQNSSGSFIDLGIEIKVDYQDEVDKIKKYVLQECCQKCFDKLKTFASCEDFNPDRIPIVIVYLNDYQDTLDAAVSIREYKGIFTRIPVLVVDCFFSRDQRVELLDRGEVDLLLDLPIKKHLFIAQINSIIRRLANCQGKKNAVNN